MREFDPAPDLAALADLRQMTGPDGFRELAEFVKSDITSTALALGAAISGSNETAARRALHKLAGILFQYGFEQPARFARELEQTPDAATVFAGAAQLVELAPLARDAFDAAARALDDA